MSRIREGETRYSEKLAGQPRNYGWAVRADVTGRDGFVGITQIDEEGFVRDRVLLSPEQWQEIVRFVAAQTGEQP